MKPTSRQIAAFVNSGYISLLREILKIGNKLVFFLVNIWMMQKIPMKKYLVNTKPIFGN